MIRALLLGCVIGGIWGAVWMIVLGMAFTLVTGNPTDPQVAAAAVSGAVAAGVCFTRTKLKWRLTHVEHFGMLFVLVAFFTGGEPLGIELRVAPYAQLLVGLTFLVVVTLSTLHNVGQIGLRRSSRYQREKQLVRLAKGFGLLFFSLMVIVPFYVMLMTSLKTQQALLVNPLDYSIDLSLGPKKLLVAYYDLFDTFEFGTFLWNSFLVSVGTVVLTLLIAIPGAYAVARMRFPGQGVLSQSILLIYMIPAIVLVIPLYTVFSQLGLRNSLFGLLIVYTATTIPVALYMLQGYFRGLPSELEEAGLIDGLKRMGVIVKITMPLSLPALASVGLYVFMIAWNEFLFAFMFLDDISIFTISRGIVTLNTAEIPRQNLMAAAVVATVPVLVLFLACERFLVTGLTAGGVKG